MRVLHVASSYPLTPGGTQAPFMEEMLAAQVRTGITVAVLVPRVSGLVEGGREGVEVIGFAHAPTPLQRWGYGRSLNSDGSLTATALAVTPLAILSMAARLRTLANRWGPDLVHLHWLMPQGLVAPVVPRAIPIVVSVHGADARFATGRLRPAAAAVVRRANTVVAASSGILEAISTVDKSARSKSVVVPHGANSSLFGAISKEHARRQLHLPQDARIVFAVGRLVPKKGFDVLIEATRQLGPDVTVVIAGDGPQRDQLTAQARAVDRSIDLLGEIDRGRLALWYAAADVVAVPSIPKQSDVDSGPVVLMEALASGTAVVTTPVGMGPDVVSDGQNGRVIPPGDSSALAAALSDVIQQATGMGERARETFRSIGDWDRVAATMRGVYERALP